MVAVVAPVVTGRIVADHRRRTAQLAELAARLEQEQAQVGALAVAQERARIARDLHDVVGHDVTVIALQADAASAALGTDPERAREPVEAIRKTAGHTLNEMRRVVGSLRLPDGEGDTLRPVPGAGDVIRLVDDARSLGDQVQLQVEGAPMLEPASVGLAVFRIVQECLTNARRHSRGAPVTVRLAWGDKAVDLRVEQPYSGTAPTRSGGLGLVGMTERARLLDGWLRAEPDGFGRFVVSARIPYAQDPVRP